jgi:hypothetical protein
MNLRQGVRFMKATTKMEKLSANKGVKLVMLRIYSEQIETEA